MGKMKGKSTARVVHFDPKFTPDGVSKDEAATFMAFYIAARKHALRLKPGRTPKSKPRSEAKSPRNRPFHNQRRVPGELQIAIASGLLALGEAAIEGDADAAKALVEEAVCAAQWLSMAQRAQPALFASLAKGHLQWPVLAGGEPGWEKKVTERISCLDLGADFRFLHTRFRKARGTDANLPARQWAKSAVRVIEEARRRPFVISGLIRDFGSSEAIADFCVENGWETVERDGWCEEVATVKPFSRDSLPQWKPVVRRMIREDLPDFHLRPEWENQRRTAAANGRDSVGEIRNAILDDVISALARLAPDKPC